MTKQETQENEITYYREHDATSYRWISMLLVGVGVLLMCNVALMGEVGYLIRASKTNTDSTSKGK